MGLLDRFRRGSAKPRARGTRVDPADAAYLTQWVRDHHGVEAYVEPETTVTDVTVVLVAADGEWTRRKSGGEQGARALGKDLHIPIYDVRKTGYPQRMRDYDARRRIERRRAAEQRDRN